MLLAGAAGCLGGVLRETLGAGAEVAAQSRAGAFGTLAADLSTPTGRELVRSTPFDVAVNAAAVSSPSACAGRPAEAWAVNVLWPVELARECRSRGIPLVHFSSDLVHAGGLPPYREGSPAVPRSFYGWCKLLADGMILRNHPGALVLRTSVLFGETPGERLSFSSKLLRGEVRKVYVDSWRNHTPVRWLASIVPELLSTGARGLVVAAARYSSSRAAFAEALFAHVGRDPSELELCYSPGGTPRRLDLLPELLARLLGRDAPDLEQALSMEYGAGRKSVK